MIRSNKILLFVFFFFLFWNPANSQDLFNAENSNKFARYLFSTRQYNLAANEYERILSNHPGDSSAFEYLLKSYRLGNICNTSFNNLPILNANQYFKNKLVAAEYLKLSLVCRKYNTENFFSEALFAVDEKDQAFYRLGYFVFEEKTDSLLHFADEHNKLLADNYSNVYATIMDIKHYKRKKPGLAAVLSAIIPGSGKAYTGYWGDAAMSLVFVSTNAWLAYKGFNKKGVKSVNGWIFGSISTGFYLGNIWGSGKAAKSYNQIKYKEFYNEAQTGFYNRF